MMQAGADYLDSLIEVVDEAIQTREVTSARYDKLYDISRIDFERPKLEFERSPRKNTTVQNLRHAVEYRQRRLLMQNPLRTDSQQCYEQIVSEYRSITARRTG